MSVQTLPTWIDPSGLVGIFFLVRANRPSVRSGNYLICKVSNNANSLLPVSRKRRLKLSRSLISGSVVYTYRYGLHNPKRRRGPSIMRTVCDRNESGKVYRKSIIRFLFWGAFDYGNVRIRNLKLIGTPVRSWLFRRGLKASAQIWDFDWIPFFPSGYLGRFRIVPVDLHSVTNKVYLKFNLYIFVYLCSICLSVSGEWCNFILSSFVSVSPDIYNSVVVAVTMTI